MTFFNAIANKKGTQEWFICKVDGRVPSPELSESVKDPDYLKLYEKSELDSQYFEYYIFKPSRIQQ
jgi:hypothetical protein